MTKLINKLLEGLDTDLPRADRFDTYAMEAHREFLHEVLDRAIDNPNDYWFQLNVFPQDGSGPLFHGTAGSLMAGLANVINTPRDEADTLIAAVKAGVSKVEAYHTLVTAERPEFWDENTNVAQGYLTTADVAGAQPAQDDGEGEVPAFLKEMAAALGGKVIDLGGGAWAVDLPAGEVQGEGDLPGAPTVEEETRLHDDGCPHVKD